MRRAMYVLLLAGCRQVFGIDTPALEPIDADSAADAPSGGAEDNVDAPCADDDADGICNAVDDWPCGLKPSAPPTTFELRNTTSSARATLSMISLAGGDTLAVVAAGASLEVRAHVTFTNATSLQPYQIEVGYLPDGHRLAGCLFNDIANLNNSVNVDEVVTAPATAGTYALLADFVRNNASCAPNSLWDVPPVTSIATICVY